jgi:hypothetical protein
MRKFLARSFGYGMSTLCYLVLFWYLPYMSQNSTLSFWPGVVVIHMIGVSVVVIAVLAIWAQDNWNG